MSVPRLRAAAQRCASHRAGGPTRLDNLTLLCRRHHRAVHEEGYRVVRSESGDLRFLLPDGRILPNAPPAVRLPEDAVARLQSAHRQQGLQIDARTPTPDWHGERLDLDFAILTLRRREAERNLMSRTNG